MSTVVRTDSSFMVRLLHICHKYGTVSSVESASITWERIASRRRPAFLIPSDNDSYCRPDLRLGTEETEAMIAFRRKMATPEAQQQYRRRSRVIEFCHAWIKSKLGLRQFHLR